MIGSYGQYIGSYRATIYDERFNLPPGLEISKAQPVMPEAQPDLLEFLREHKEAVSLAIGIPFSFLSSEQRKGTGGKMAAEDSEIFQSNLGNMKRQLCNLMERLYVSQFPDLQGISDLHFDLLTTPYVGPDMIQKLSDRNVISEEMAKKFVAATMGINQIHVIDKENPRTTIPVGGNEHQTGPRLSKEDARIEAETSVFLADADAKRAQAEKLRAEANAIKAESTGENNEGELINKEMQMKKMEIEGKMKIMDKQMELSEVQTENAIQRLVAQKQNAVKPQNT